MLSLAISNFTFGLNQLRQHQEESSTSLERLATGKRINRAKDDPSGLQAVTKLKSEEYAIKSQLESFDQERAFLGTQEGALSVMSELLIKLNGLTVESANGDVLSESQLDANRDEAASIIQAIDLITTTTELKGEQALTGFRTRDLARQTITIEDPETGETRQREVSLANIAEFLIDDPELAQSLAKEAAESVSSRRAVIGTRLNSIDSESRSLMTELENTSAARSDIEDTDFAEETAKLVRAQLLEEATIQSILLQRESLESLLDLFEPAKAGIKNAN